MNRKNIFLVTEQGTQPVFDDSGRLSTKISARAAITFAIEALVTAVRMETAEELDLTKDVSVARARVESARGLLMELIEAIAGEALGMDPIESKPPKYSPTMKHRGPSGGVDPETGQSYHDAETGHIGQGKEDG